jgi:hypothetical protein
MFEQIRGWLFSAISSGARRARSRRSRLSLEPLEARVVPTIYDYYISQSGSDTRGDGSQGNPWKTIAPVEASGFTFPSGTDTLNFVASSTPYDVGTGLKLSSLNNLSNNPTLTVQSYDSSGQGLRATLSTSSTTGVDYGIQVEDAGNITIQSINLQGAWTSLSNFTPGSTYDYGINFVNDTGISTSTQIAYSNIVIDSVNINNYALHSAIRSEGFPSIISNL